MTAHGSPTVAYDVPSVFGAVPDVSRALTMSTIFSANTCLIKFCSQMLVYMQATI